MKNYFDCKNNRVYVHADVRNANVYTGVGKKLDFSGFSWICGCKRVVQPLFVRQAQQSDVEVVFKGERARRNNRYTIVHSFIECQSFNNIFNISLVALIHTMLIENYVNIHQVRRHKLRLKKKHVSVAGSGIIIIDNIN